MATLVGSRRTPGGARGDEAGPAADRPPPARAPRHARDEYELLVEAIYEGYLLHYGAARGAPPPRPISGCSRAIACTRSAWHAWSRLATPRRWRSWPTRSRSARSLRPRASRSSPRRSGRPARGPSAGARAPPTRAKRLAFAALARSDRGDAHKRCGRPGVALNSRLDIVRRRCPTSTTSTSPSTRSTANPRARSRARRSRAGAS